MELQIQVAVRLPGHMALLMAAPAVLLVIRHQALEVLAAAAAADIPAAAAAADIPAAAVRGMNRLTVVAADLIMQVQAR